MDELDVKIFRWLVSGSAVSPTSLSLRASSSSLREIAANLGADDMTVRNRFKKFVESRALASLKVVVNPSFFGYEMLDILLDVEPESGKKDMIRKLKLIHGVVGIINYYGKLLKVVLLYDGEEFLSRTIELISRITNAQGLHALKARLPRSETKSLTTTDVAIINSLSDDAFKSSALVAKELGLSTRTVRNRISKLWREMTLFALPDLNLGGVPGFIPVSLSYSYANQGVKDEVDLAMRSRFDTNYLWGGFADPDRGFIVLALPTMLDVQAGLDWAKEQPGVGSARADIHVETIALPGKLKELARAADLRQH